jgi:hypothetical protein
MSLGASAVPFVQMAIQSDITLPTPEIPDLTFRRPEDKTFRDA